MKKEKGERAKESVRSQETRERRGKRRGRNSKRVGSPPPLSVVHVMEDRVPHLGLNISAVVFIEFVVRATVPSSYLQSFSDYEIVCQFSLILVVHSFNDFRFRPVDRLLAMLFCPFELAIDWTGDVGNVEIWLIFLRIISKVDASKWKDVKGVVGCASGVEWCGVTLCGIFLSSP